MRQIRSSIKTLALVLMLSIAAAHRLPAPIQELPESPTPAPEQSAKPKRTRTKSVESEPGSSSTQARTNPTPVPRPPKKFAGTWVGVMPEVPWGNIHTKLIVNDSETTMEWEDGLVKNRPTVRTELNGDTISAHFDGWPKPVWYITPRADGTANVRLTAFMNDQTAVFQRQSSSAPADAPAKVTAQSSSEIPTARPVPERPGFVYNPFDPNSHLFLDVRGKPSGTKLIDPKSGKAFLVP